MDVRVGSWRLNAEECYFWTVVFKKTLENPLDCKIKPVNPKGNQSWIFIGRTDVEAPILRPSDGKSQLIKKRPWCWGRLKAGEEDDGGWEEDDGGWDGWMTSLIQWTLVWACSRDGEGQGSLACCSPWGHKESDRNEWLKNKKKHPNNSHDTSILQCCILEKKKKKLCVLMTSNTD